MLYICGRCHCGHLAKWKLVFYGILHIEITLMITHISHFVDKETECQGLVPVNTFLKGHSPGELSAYWLLVCHFVYPSSCMNSKHSLLSVLGLSGAFWKCRLSLKISGQGPWPAPNVRCCQLSPEWRDRCVSGLQDRKQATVLWN